MKKTTLLLMVIIATINSVIAAKITINNVGTTFSPAQVTIHINDTVQFVLESAHNAVEVSKATYDANGTTSNGGFSVPNGGGTIIFHNAGIFYFVCQPHASLGMKGIITVTGTTGINSLTATNSTFTVYPNPINDFVGLSYWLESKANVTVNLISISGKHVATFVSEVRYPGFQEDSYPI